MKMATAKCLLGLGLVLAACSPPSAPVGDGRLDTFVQVFSECARISRVYSDDPDMLSDELRQVRFPGNWAELVDSLTASHGDVDFWIDTFDEISARARR